MYFHICSHVYFCYCSKIKFILLLLNFVCTLMSVSAKGLDIVLLVHTEVHFYIDFYPASHVNFLCECIK